MNLKQMVGIGALVAALHGDVDAKGIDLVVADPRQNQQVLSALNSSIVGIDSAYSANSRYNRLTCSVVSMEKPEPLIRFSDELLQSLEPQDVRLRVSPKVDDKLGSYVIIEYGSR